MDLFGLKEHDDRHDQLEQRIRTLVEQVAQLTIDHATTEAKLRTLEAQVSGKADQADVDPVLIALNDGLTQARTSLAATTGAAENQWNAASEKLSESLANLRTSIEKPAHQQVSSPATAR